MKADIAVIGGGLAGASAAARLASAGREVVLFERETAPHDKVCGEFVSYEAAHYLKELGVDLPGLGAERIVGTRIAIKGRIVSTPLPFPAFSLSRRVLDEAVLRRAEARGVQIMRGVRVVDLDGKPDAWTIRLADDSCLVARHVFLATGKHDLRGWRRPGGLQSDLIGLKMHLRLTLAQRRELARHVELMTFDGGYAGLEPVEEGRTNLCLLVRRSRFARADGNWNDLLAVLRRECPLLDMRLENARPCFERPLAIAAIPYGFIRRRGDGIWRLGDQAAVIPSFSGDGMSIALHSGRLAAEYFLKGVEPAEFQRRLARDVAGSVRLATFLSLLAVRPAGQALLECCLRWMPRAAMRVASATRVPPPALRRAGMKIAEL